MTELVYEVVEDDKTIPEGWKSALSPDRSLQKIFWDSDKRFLSSRVEAVKVMVGDKRRYTAKEIETMKRGLISEGWEKHPGLPEGWMYRASSISVSSWGQSFTDHQFLAPDFEIIHNPGFVLRRFINSGMYKNESAYSKFVLNFCIEVEKDQIESFEWIEAPHKLRLGKFFLKSEEDFIQIVISKDGRIFKNKSDAFLEDVRYDEDYLQDEKEEIHDLLVRHFSVKPQEKTPLLKQNKSVASNHQKKNTNEWLDDIHLPEGWKYRLKNFAAKDDSKRKMFRAPNGNLLRARLQAVEYLVETKASQEDIDKMKNGLIEEEDWETDDILPATWLLKYRKKGDSTHGCYFMNKEGEVLRNFTQAHRDLLEKGYDKKFLANLQTFYKARKGFVNNSDDDANVKHFVVGQDTLDDPLDTTSVQSQKTIFVDEVERSLPAGWKSTVITGGLRQRKFEAPDGKETNGILEALKYMTFVLVTPQADIDAVRSMLAKQEGWKTDSKIPPGWLFKKLEAYTHYLTKEHDVLYGHGAAWEYMKNKDYPDLIISEFKKNFNPKPVQGNRDKLNKTIEKSEEISVSESSNKSKNLPPGWKYKEKYMDSNRAMYFNVFISPQGNVYRSLVKVMNTMLSMKYSMMDIATMKSNLLDEGWKMDENLPIGWLYKKMDHRIYYLTEKFETIRGHKLAVKYLEENKYSRINIERITWCGKKNKERVTQKLEDGVESVKVAVKEEPVDKDVQLPADWRFVDGKVCNADGDNYQSILEAVSDLVAKDHDPKLIYDLWSTLHLEGWELGPGLLPMGWRIKFVGPESDLGYQFLAREMCVLKEEQEVLDYLEDTEDYTQENINNFKQWVKSSRVERESDSVFENISKRRRFS